MAHFYTWPSIGLLLTVVREGGKEKKRERRNRWNSEQLPPWNFWISARQWRVLEEGNTIPWSSIRSLCGDICSPAGPLLCHPSLFLLFWAIFFFSNPSIVFFEHFLFRARGKTSSPPSTHIQHNNAHRELEILSCSNFSIFFMCVSLPSLPFGCFTIVVPMKRNEVGTWPTFSRAYVVAFIVSGTFSPLLWVEETRARKRIPWSSDRSCRPLRM